jgi:hypothetical protein
LKGGFCIVGERWPAAGVVDCKGEGSLNLE